jgi:outer membrane protein TolC
LLLVVPFVGWPWLCHAQEPEPTFTTRSSIEHALKRSIQILSSKEEVAAAEANKRKQFSGFLPTLSARYNYTRLDEEKADFLSIVTRPHNLYSFTATIDQPVFSGLSTSTQYKISGIGVSIARMLEVQARQDLILRVKRAYFEVLQREELEKVAQQAVTQLTATAKVAKEFYEVGMRAKNDVLEAEVGLANAQQDLVVARNEVDLAKSRFNTVLRRPIDAPVVLEDVVGFEPLTVTYEACVETALKHRPEFQVADLEVEAAEREVKLARSSYYPSVDLQGNYYTRGDTFQLDGDAGISDRSEWEVLATATWTFYEGGKTRYSVREKHTRLSQARLKRTELEDNVRQEVKSAHLAVKASENAILTVQKAVEQAQENFRMNEERYKQQVSTSTELLIAQTLLTQTQTNYLNALLAFNVSKAALDRAMGVEVLE